MTKETLQKRRVRPKRKGKETAALEETNLTKVARIASFRGRRNDGHKKERNGSFLFLQKGRGGQVTGKYAACSENMTWIHLQEEQK